MLQVIESNPLLAGGALALFLLAIVLFLASRRRTRVRFADDGAPARRNQALIDSAPVALSADAVGGEEIASELSRLKGVGPKLVAQLADLGVTRLDQVAAWTAEDIAQIDPELGRFSGRIEQDEWVTQAQLLQSGDPAAFEDRFGKL